jgi:hypothetical protein
MTGPHDFVRVTAGRFRHPWPHGNDNVPAAVADDLARAVIMLRERLAENWPESAADKAASEYAWGALQRAKVETNDTPEGER